jgi:hypothetical protein
MQRSRRTYKLIRIAILLGAALVWMGPPRPPAPPGCRGPRPPRPPLPYSEAIPAQPPPGSH